MVQKHEGRRSGLSATLWLCLALALLAAAPVEAHRSRHDEAPERRLGDGVAEGRREERAEDGIQALAVLRRRDPVLQVQATCAG